jgi:hypothetical protein
MVNNTFYLSKAQIEKYVNWCETKSDVYAGAFGGAITICFTPTGIGVIVVAKCIDGTEIDLTEYEHF